ncbi:MAG: hypothetical protein L6V93_16140 [Clostridiales bacterium]|nr:MAG: hypothetical protein L6V93_16140 [Clostridiales bacterium]
MQTKNSVITEDKRNFSALMKKHGINCLLIRSGYVSLKGYKNGFIGGASVKINKNTLAFFGEIEKNTPTLKKINGFFERAEYQKRIAQKWCALRHRERGCNIKFLIRKEV